LITSPARAADRVVGASGPPPRALSASSALILLLLGGLALRLTIAYILFPASGFPSDVASYVSWAMSMAEHSPGNFYPALAAAQSFIDYPPGYLYVLWPIGAVAQAFGGSDPWSLATALVKIPPMVVDLVVGYVLYRLVLGWAWPGRRAEALALAAAALYLFNPVTMYDSALWGQTDSIGALVILLGVAALVRGNSEGAALLGALAALVKPQFGLVLIPLVAVLLIRRHLLRPGSGPRRSPWGPSWLRGWLARVQGWPRLVTSAVVALVTFHVVALPFGMGVTGYLEMMANTAAGYQYLSVNAFNPWALIGADGAQSIAASSMIGGYQWSSDTVPLAGPLPGVVIGGALLIAGFLYGLGNVLWRDERRTIIVATVFLCLCFFVLPTRVHERYLLPVFAVVPLLAVTSRAWLAALVALALGCLLNLHAVLTIYGSEDIQDLPLGYFSRGTAGIVLAVLLITGVLVFCAWRLWRGAAREPDGFALAAAHVQGTIDLGPVPETARSVQRVAAPQYAAPATTRPAESPPPAPEPAGYVRGPSALDWIVDRITSRPLRRDRSAALAGEPAGRLDRLDLLVVLCILLSAVTVRGYRLAEPYDMYFDEVYHARTAMEFLQDWRYDDPHSIYEYTHPHLAKYAMALGIEMLGDHRVTGRSQIGGPVLGAAIEPRWTGDDASARVGDRLYAVTGTELLVYDLADRTQVATIPADATAVTLDPDMHQLYLANRDGTVGRIDTTAFDELRRAAGPVDVVPGSLALDPAGGEPQRLEVAGQTLVTLGAGGSLVARDLDSGEVLSSTTLVGARDLVSFPVAKSAVARPGEIEDIPGTAEVLAEDLGLDVSTITALLETDLPEVVLEGWLDSGASTDLNGHIEDGTLAGIEIDDRPIVAVSTPEGVSFLDAATLASLEQIGLDEGADGMVWADNAPEEARLYLASGTELRSVLAEDDGPQLKSTVDLPGAISDVVWNEPTQLVHAVGTQPDGTPTIYVIDPHGNSVFMDVPLPFSPVVTVADTQPDRPSQDRTQILALAGDGATASVDIGGNAWGYRLPGVLMGAATAAFLYLLARMLFRRRAVGLFAAALAIAEGMLFANSRIAMNDVYVTGFLVMAATFFVPVWLGSWRRRWQVLLALPLVGVLLGLALASKWVAAYAIGCFVLLMLLRSGLGRLIALAGMVGITAVLGALAIRPADVPDPHRNWPFLAIMMVLTLALAGAIVRRPLRLTRAEIWAAVVWLVILGVGVFAAWLVFGSSLPDEGLLGTRGALLLAGGSMAGAAILGIGALVAGRLGHGPFMPRQDGYLEEPAVSDSPGWLSPGTLVGIPWLLALGCLALLPIVVYVLSYAPWVALGNQFWDGFPAGNTGQTVADLTVSMYRYHDDLRVPHAASSPWWAWPLDLKPVWYYQEGFADRTTGAIYDTGNLVIFWMGIPALIFGGLAAWRRRSLSLTVVMLLFAAMWLPWVRIDRATFQYHYYTSVPFIVLALAYLLAELWHGPARIAWLLARVGAALCVIGAPLLWLLREPLCLAANTQAVNAGAEVCGQVGREVALTDQSLAVLTVLAIGGVVAAWQLWRASHGASASGREEVQPGQGGRTGRVLAGLADGPMGGIVVTAGATLLAIVACVLLLSDQRAVRLQVGANELALLALVVLAGPAWLVVRARDARRFAMGIVIAAGLWLLIWYPNLTGLPMPTGLSNIYQGLLPTWNYAFQFAVNLDPPVKGGIVDAGTIVIALLALVAVAAVMLVAHRWRSRPPSNDLSDLV
jgi:hypothetical protein